MAYQQQNRPQKQLPRKEDVAKAEGFPPEKLEEFVVFVGDQPYITGAGLQWKMLKQYGPGKFAVQTLVPSLDEYNLLRRMMGLPEEEPLVVMRGEVWVIGFDRPFVDYGTASKNNLKGFVKFSDYPLEMACRRASNRAMRLATATGMCSVDEIQEGGEVTGQSPGNDTTEDNYPPLTEPLVQDGSPVDFDREFGDSPPETPTTDQLDLLFNLSKVGQWTKEENEKILDEIASLDTRQEASDLIDLIKSRIEARKGTKRTESTPTPDEHIDFDREFGGSPPDAPPPSGTMQPSGKTRPQVESQVDSEEPKKKGARNIPQEVRIAFGYICKGTLTAMGATIEDKKYEMRFKNHFLGGIMFELGIDPQPFVHDDGFIHTKDMPAAQSTKLLNALRGPGALHSFKDAGSKALKIATSERASADLFEKGQQDAKAPEAGNEAETSKTPPEAPDAGAEEAPVEKSTEATPEQQMEGLKKSIAALQEALSSDYGPDGIKLAAKILQKNHLGAGGEKTIENCTGAVEQLTSVYRRLSMKEDIAKVSMSLK